MVMDDLQLIILRIPLIDKSLQMNLYKVHNLPALQSELKSQFFFVLEGQYLVVSKQGMYTPLAIEHDICICMAT